MKTLLIASMIAFAGTAALIAPAQAASLTIQSDDDDQYSSDDGDIQILRHHQRHKDYSDDYGDDYSDNQDGQWRRATIAITAAISNWSGTGAITTGSSKRSGSAADPIALDLLRPSLATGAPI
ncbi:hypothetical protein [Mesorhizobium sp. M0771]|uniref:hypothetical protein n=1 Tax=Mesorhizobium sp. M0771 TaxID=2956997 RepID=UPI003336AE3E